MPKNLLTDAVAVGRLVVVPITTPESMVTVGLAAWAVATSEQHVRNKVWNCMLVAVSCKTAPSALVEPWSLYIALTTHRQRMLSAVYGRHDANTPHEYLMCRD